MKYQKAGKKKANMMSIFEDVGKEKGDGVCKPDTYLQFPQ